MLNTENDRNNAVQFAEYLRQKRLGQGTIKENLRNLRHFTTWLEKERIELPSTTYNDLTAYIAYLQQRGLTPATINIQLRTIEKYYDYCLSASGGKTKKNPARTLRIKGARRRALPEILTPEQLEKIYHAYINKPKERFKGNRSILVHSRNIVLLSLLIYQDLHAGEIGKLEVSHINLAKGTIYIPSGGRYNSRTLKLQAMQQIIIQNYLQHTRPELIKLQSIETNKLFDIIGKAHDMVAWLLKDLKRLTPIVQSAKQIRVSVIMNWLKNYNIRQVQYMAGHRYISSTEKYKQEDLRDLQLQLNLFHPLSDLAKATSDR